MEHAKKMVLLSQEALKHMRKEVEPKSHDPVTDLDTQMNDILKSSLDDREKWKQYQQVLQRFLYYSQESRKPISLTLKEDPSLIEDGEKNMKGNATVSPMEIENILHTMPATARKRAELLCQRLQESSSFNWNTNGEVSINNEVIPGTNIVDLINDAVRNRKYTNPKGWEQFARVLHDLHVPQEFINNSRRWTYIRSLNTDAATSSGIQSTPDITFRNKKRTARTPNTEVARLPRKRKNLGILQNLGIQKSLIYSLKVDALATWKILRLRK